MTDNGSIPPQAPPGWYADPASPDLERWWSGSIWAANTRLTSTANLPAPAVGSGSISTTSAPNIALGLGIGSLLLAPIGIAAIVVGIVGLNRTAHGSTERRIARWGLALGAIAVALWGSLFAAYLAQLDSVPGLDIRVIESSIRDGIQEQLGIVVSVECPPAPSAEPGSTFTCVATGSSGTNSLVDVTVQDRTGYVVWRVS